jgi:hypothetical protein
MKKSTVVEVLSDDNPVDLADQINTCIADWEEAGHEVVNINSFECNKKAWAVLTAKIDVKD